MTIEERLVDLEWQNVKLKISLALLLGLVLIASCRSSAAIATSAQQGRFKKIVAEELSIADVEGRETCSIRPPRDTPQEKGSTVVFSLGRPDRGVEIMDFAGGVHLTLTGGSSSVNLGAVEKTASYISAESGKAEVALSAYPDPEPHAGISVSDGSKLGPGGIPHARLGIETGSPHLDMTDSGGKTFTIGADGKGKAH